MSALRFRITTGTGLHWTGPVQGNGGMLGDDTQSAAAISESVARLRDAKERDEDLGPVALSAVVREDRDAVRPGLVDTDERAAAVRAQDGATVELASRRLQ